MHECAPTKRVNGVFVAHSEAPLDDFEGRSSRESAKVVSFVRDDVPRTFGSTRRAKKVQKTGKRNLGIVVSSRRTPGVIVNIIDLVQGEWANATLASAFNRGHRPSGEDQV